MKEALSEVLSRKETAQLLGIDIRTLDRWRKLGHGPAYLDLTCGRGKKPCIRYRKSELERFLLSSTKRPVAEN